MKFKHRGLYQTIQIITFFIGVAGLGGAIDTGYGYLPSSILFCIGLGMALWGLKNE